MDGRMLGKPTDAAAARQRIGALAGRTHTVLSGLALIGAGRTLTRLIRTEVEFRDLGEPEMNRYVASGEWRDRAGGYAVQGLGSSLVAGIDGDLSNVIGLPIPALVEMIEELQDR
jgi:nucleoside triphosphate pyrophosphatase